MIHLPRLYPIVDVGTLAARGLDLGAFVRELLAGGATVLQLRDKDGSPEQVLRGAAEMSEAAKIAAGESGSRCVLVMNDRVDLAVLAGWQAVHLGHKDLPAEEAKALAAGQAMLVGVSTHNDEQVRAADAGPADYVAVGPVFGTFTKADTEPVVGLEGVARARALTRKPLVAIGGITLENAPSVLAAGADSVAVIGGLFRPGQTAAATVQDFLRRLG